MGALKLPLTCDEARKPTHQRKLSRAARDYERSLIGVARHVGELIKAFEPGDPSVLPTLQQLLDAYARALVPWAEKTAGRMLAEVNERDWEAWRKLGTEISAQLHQDIKRTPVGEIMRRLLNEQVTLIKSLPLEAGQRVHELTLKGLEDSTRYRQYVDEIERSGEVTRSRAILIARTETSRTATVLTEARAKSAGSTHFVWHTSEDSDVRPDHKILDKKIFPWNEPPVADQRSGARALPGAIYNCRCWAEPLLSE